MIASGTLQKLKDYSHSVLDGNVVVGGLVKHSVERFYRDIERQDTPEFPYVFRERLAASVIDFFPLMLKHTIGEYAGLPFELEPWQAFAVGNLFGWTRTDGSRRFRKAYLSVARKNGKSSLAAGLALYCACLDINPHSHRPEDVAEVILCATKKEQVEKVVYAEIQRMRERSSHMSKLSTPINRQISFKHNAGSIRCIGSDKPFDGLNPHCVIMDELHAWREYHRKFYDTMITGSGSRTQPLIVTITTAGDNESHIWLDEYQYANQVVKGEINDDSLFAMCYELDEHDEISDEANWPKSNPNIGVSVKLDYLREQAKPTSQVARSRFQRYHANRLVSSTERAIEMPLWDACCSQLSDWKLADAVCGGIDNGSRDDLSAFAMCARFPVAYDGDKTVYRYEAKVWTFLADSTDRDLTQQPFAQWIYDGLIDVTKYPVSELKARVLMECELCNVETIAYDPWNAQQLSEDLTAEGLKVARMSQNPTHFNEPIRDFLAAIENKLFVHDGNPLLRWCANNAIIHRDRSDRWMFDKASSNEKIDPLVALVMAFREVTLAPERATGSLYIC